MRLSIFVVALAAATLVSAAPVIDDTPTRVQTPLKVDMRPVGTLRPKAVGEVSASRWTIDGATLDREHYDWRTIREYLPPLGIPTDSGETKTVEVSVAAPPFANPVWVDVLSGNAYRIDAAQIRAEDGRTVYSVPGYDSPTFITDRSVLTLDESWEARWLREQDEAK